jgi:hypothetical protein
VRLYSNTSILMLGDDTLGSATKWAWRSGSWRGRAICGSIVIGSIGRGRSWYETSSVKAKVMFREWILQRSFASNWVLDVWSPVQSRRRPSIPLWRSRWGCKFTLSRYHPNPRISDIINPLPIDLRLIWTFQNHLNQPRPYDV